MFSATRYHDISCGHRVAGHEGKCRHLHGHNYRIHFTCTPERDLDKLGRVIDFTVIKESLCDWLELNWDHKFLAWERDHVMQCAWQRMDGPKDYGTQVFHDSIVFVPFNPTAEAMAKYLVEVVGPAQLVNTGVRLTSVTIEETAKCQATYELEGM